MSSYSLEHFMIHQSRQRALSNIHKILIKPSNYSNDYLIESYRKIQRFIMQDSSEGDDIVAKFQTI